MTRVRAGLYLLVTGNSGSLITAKDKTEQERLFTGDEQEYSRLSFWFACPPSSKPADDQNTLPIVQAQFVHKPDCRLPVMKDETHAHITYECSVFRTKYNPTFGICTLEEAELTPSMALKILFREEAVEDGW